MGSNRFSAQQEPQGRPLRLGLFRLRLSFDGYATCRPEVLADVAGVASGVVVLPPLSDASAPGLTGPATLRGRRAVLRRRPDHQSRWLPLWVTGRPVRPSISVRVRATTSPAAWVSASS